MININMQSTIRQAERQFASVSRELKDKAIVRALNDTIAKANTQSSREIKAQGYNLPVKNIKENIKLDKANRHHLRAVLKALPNAINLRYFGAKQIGKSGYQRNTKGQLSYKKSRQSGVRVKVKGNTTILRHAFIGRRGFVMERTQSGIGANYGIMKMRGGFQIDGGQVKLVSGVPVSKMIQNDIVWNKLTDLARDHFPVRLQHHLRRAMR